MYAATGELNMLNRGGGTTSPPLTTTLLVIWTMRLRQANNNVGCADAFLKYCSKQKTDLTIQSLLFRNGAKRRRNSTNTAVKD